MEVELKKIVESLKELSTLFKASGIQNYKVNQQNKLERATDKAEDVSNARIAALSNQLIVICTVLITFSSPIFLGASNLTISFSLRLVLFIGWLFFTLSIIFGLSHTYIDHKFFKIWADGQDKVARYLSDSGSDDMDKMRKTMVRMQQDLPPNSSSWPMILQFTFLANGFIFFVVFISILLLR